LGRDSSPTAALCRPLRPCAQAICLLRTLGRPARLAEELATIVACLGRGCLMAKRSSCPNPLQLWLDPALGRLT
jgi:hypothetical protein